MARRLPGTSALHQATRDDPALFVLHPHISQGANCRGHLHCADGDHIAGACAGKNLDYGRLGRGLRRLLNLQAPGATTVFVNRDLRALVCDAVTSTATAEITLSATTFRRPANTFITTIRRVALLLLRIHIVIGGATRCRFGAAS